ncbi:MAG: aminoglycoside phosphotransferase family protein [Firmicutes bacterium]|nr:aminoglycoside phosphotransferase family protein [Bacillota bacterium]
MEKIGEGMVSEAFLIDRRVMLVAKRKDSFKRYQELKVNLDLLEGKIKSLIIPSGAQLIDPCTEYPLGAMSFNYVPGTELAKKIDTCTNEQKVAIGEKLAEFIVEMQNSGIVMDKQKEVDLNNEKQRKALEIIRSYLNVDENKKLERLAVKYSEFMAKTNFTMTHGDLHEWNLLVDDDNKLVGIIDFGNVEYYVPEIEFHFMLDFDPVIYNAMMKNYKGQDIDIQLVHLTHIVRFVRFLKNVMDWPPDKIQAQVDKVRRLLANYKPKEAK